MRHFFCDSLKRFFVACALTVVGIFSATAATLPSGYTELEYISTIDGAGPYIDTGLVVGSNTRVLAQYKLKNTGFTFPFSVRDTTTAGAGFGVGVNGSQQFISDYNGDRKIFTTVTPNTTDIITVDKNKNVCTITIGGQSETVTNTASTFTTTGKLPFFAQNSSGTTAGGGYAFYSFKMWQNEVLVRDFVPAKNSSGVVGMYDTVNDQFYTNAGTGAFTAGPMACNGTRVNYTTATGTVTQSGTPTPTNPITPTFYTQGDMVLRKVGDYADSYDATTGKITRRVGVKVLDGTENWVYDTSGGRLDSMYNLVINDMFADASSVTSNRQSPYSTHFARSTSWISNSAETRLNKIQAYTPSAGTPILGLGYQDVSSANIPTFKSWLAAQHAAGTPVIVYYPLKTAVVEDWPAEQCVAGTGIKIATTKYTEDAFAGLMTTLSEAITKVTNIVDTTVQQATEIGNLATTKQDRPDTDCPAGRKCLLIMGADNKPHWYLIQE